MKSEILDPLDKHKVSRNLPPEEVKLLEKLIQLQREKHNVIKPCDKVIILGFQNYMMSCQDNLS